MDTQTIMAIIAIAALVVPAIVATAGAMVNGNTEKNKQLKELEHERYKMAEERHKARLLKMEHKFEVILKLFSEWQLYEKFRTDEIVEKQKVTLELGQKCHEITLYLENSIHAKKFKELWLYINDDLADFDADETGKTLQKEFKYEIIADVMRKALADEREKFKADYPEFFTKKDEVRMERITDVEEAVEYVRTHAEYHDERHLINKINKIYENPGYRPAELKRINMEDEYFVKKIRDKLKENYEKNIGKDEKTI